MLGCLFTLTLFPSSHATFTHTPSFLPFQMSCILAAFEDSSIAPHLTKDCKEKLKKRKEMWELAARIAPVETLAEIVETIQLSPNRNYFAIVLFSCLAVIFMFGLCCGRVTKRLKRQVKDR